MPERPLLERLYVQPHLYEVVRKIGYVEHTVEETRRRLKELELEHTFDKELIVAACDELLDIGPKCVKLKAHVRKISHQLLGRDPELPPMQSTLEMMGVRPAEPEPKKPEPKKKERKPPKKTRSKEPDILPMPGAESARTDTPKKAVTAPGYMRQFREAKERHPGMILLFRMGDFYEMFEEDARTAAKILGLTITSRDKTFDMAGFPHHQLENYLRKLLASGKRVAVCDPVEGEPEARQVNRVVMTAKSPDETADEIEEVISQLESE